MSNYIRLLRSNHNYALLWLAQVISLTGDWFNTITLSALVARYNSDNPGVAVSVFFLARFLPPLIVSPFVGVLADRFERKNLLILSNVLRALVVLGYLLVTTSEMVWLIYALSIAQSMLSAIAEPAQSALIPNIVDEKDLVLSNTLSSITWSAMLSVGAIIGGVVASVFGAAFALTFDALTFVAAALLIWQIHPRPIQERKKTHAEEGSFRDGLAYLAKHRETLAVMFVKGGNSLGNVDTLMTIFGTQIFILGVDGQLSLGLMYSAFGIGAVLGPVMMNRFHDGSVRQMERLLLVGFLFALTGWLVMGSAGALWIVLVALFIRAIGGSVNWTYSSVILQKTVPDQFLGRVFSLDMAIFQLATVLSTYAHGALVDVFGKEYVRAIALGTAGVALLPLILWSINLRVKARGERIVTEKTEPQILD